MDGKVLSGIAGRAGACRARVCLGGGVQRSLSGASASGGGSVGWLAMACARNFWKVVSGLTMWTCARDGFDSVGGSGLTWEMVGICLPVYASLSNPMLFDWSSDRKVELARLNTLVRLSCFPIPRGYNFYKTSFTLSLSNARNEFLKVSELFFSWIQHRAVLYQVHSLPCSVETPRIGSRNVVALPNSSCKS